MVQLPHVDGVPDRIVALHDEWYDRTGHPDAVYTERARLVAFLASAYPSRIGPDPDDPAWYIVTVDAPTGQMSWHISDHDRLDLHLFDHVRPVMPGDAPWDGHSTAEKYDRLEELVALNDAAPWDTQGTFQDRAQRGVLRTAIDAVWAVLSSPRVHAGTNPSFPDAEPVRMVLVEDIVTALNGAVPEMARPGPLRWKFDGGRGAMVDLNDRIVGYYNPSSERTS